MQIIRSQAWAGNHGKHHDTQPLGRVEGTATATGEILRHESESPRPAILDQAANASDPPSRFPHDLIALVEPGEDIHPFIDAHDEPQRPIDL